MGITFYRLGQGRFEGEKLKCSQFHSWFYRGVAQWLDIALYKALKRTQKAVELGNLKPIHDDCKFSSSAVDTLTIFYQVKAVNTCKNTLNS